MSQIKQVNENDVFILPLSAKSKGSLEQYQKVLASYLQEIPNDLLANIAYTLQEKREFYTFRNHVVCRTTEEAIEQLNHLSTASQLKRQHQEPKVIFMFPGQGSQYSGMCSYLYENEALFKNCVDECFQILARENSIDFHELLFSENNQAVNQTQYTQPLLFVVSYALAKLFNSWGVTASAYIGHSLGEFVAATLAGVFSLEDALRVVAKRGKLMQSMPAGGMLAVGRSAAEISEYLTHTIELAATNAPEYCVVSGPTKDINQLKTLLDKRNIPSSVLRTSHAFHSAMMENAAQAFTQFLANITLNAPETPFVSNMTGQFITEQQAMSPEYWGQHMRKPVLFSEGVTCLMQQYDEVIFCEVGPGHTLCTFTKQQQDRNGTNLSAIHTVLPAKMYKELPANKEDLQAYHAVAALWRGNYPVQFAAISKSKTAKIALLPPYQFERQRCWVNKPVTPRSDLEMNPRSKWLYKPTWKRLASIAKHNEAQASIEETWLIFADESGLSAELVSQLAQLEQKYVVVKINKQIPDFSIADTHFQMNPFAEKSYQKLFAYLNEHQYKPSLIVHAWTVTNDQAAYKDESTEGKLYYGFYSLFLIQKHLLSNYNHTIKLLVLTNGIAQITGEDIIHPEKATLLGAVRAIPHEIPQINSLCLDVGFKQFSANYILNFAQVNEHYEQEPSYSIKMNALWREDLELITSPIQPQKLVQDNDVILITGGLGGIGLSIANEIAKHHKVTFILTSRKPFDLNLPENEQSDTYKFQQSVLSAIKNNGSQVDIDCIDIADDQAVMKLVERVKQKYGAINGIVHAAGVEPLGLVDKSIEKISTVFSAKVFGTEHLLNGLNGEKLNFFIMTSSITSFMGTVGTIEYCAANSYLDVLSSSISYEMVDSFLSINWPAWSDVGMAHKFKSFNKTSNALDQLNVINSKQGTELFYALMNQNEHNQVVVSKFDLQALKEKIFANNRKMNDSITPSSDNKKGFLTDSEFTDLEEKIAQLFHEVLGVEQFSKHDNFFDLGGSSLSVVQLVSKLKTINLFPSITDIMKNNSVFLLGNYDSTPNVEKIVVPLKLNLGAKKNVFFVHPVGGTLILYTNMINQLDPSYNYYGIQNINIASEVMIETDSLVQLAKHYVQEIQKIQAQGTYIFMGASMGGTIAYEMARQLVHQKKQVQFVAMFDSWATFSEKSHNENEFRDYMYSQMKSEFDEFASKLSELDVEHHELIKNICDARWKLMTLLLNYSIPNGDVEIKLHQFKAKVLDSFHINNENTPDNGWSKYTQVPVSSYEIDGDHISILEEPGLSQIIADLNVLLAGKNTSRVVGVKTTNDLEFNYSEAI